MINLFRNKPITISCTVVCIDSKTYGGEGNYNSIGSTNDTVYVAVGKLN